MRIDVHDASRKKRGRITIDPTQRPPRTAIEEDESGGDVFLDWDGSLDDAGHLRKCLICGNKVLFRVRTLPSVAPILVILAFAGVAISILGFASNPIILGLMVVVVIAELVILLIARTQLVCYRCRTKYAETPIAPYHQPYDPQTAELPTNQPDFAAEPEVPDEAEVSQRQQPRRERLAQMRIDAAEEAARGDTSSSTPAK